MKLLVITAIQEFEKEIQQKFKEVLQATFARMDLITREEFDVQCKVLARTREKLDQLQAQVDELASHKKTKSKKETD